MIPPGSLAAHPQWPALAQAMQTRLERHGDTPRWRAAVAALPDVNPRRLSFGPRVTAAGPIEPAEQQQLRRALKELQPWRKGPFELFGVHLDTEWRSDWKWQRVAPALGSLEDQRVLDVGCGNGYFGWRLLEAGASEVIGVDPSVLFYLQHQAICHYLTRQHPWPNHLLPLPFEALPDIPFDLVLSMGVIYHRSDPLAHLEKLYSCTRPGGRLLLESLVVEQGPDLHPAADSGNGRYARMRNVHVVPELLTMMDWIRSVGFRQPQLLDLTITSTAEQRRTEWMTFESLAESLDPSDSGRTLEGYPAPRRAAVLAQRPG